VSNITPEVARSVGDAFYKFLVNQQSGSNQPEPSVVRQKEAAEILRKTAYLQSLIGRGQQGLDKIAAYIGMPVRKRMDYAPSLRQTLVVQDLPPGIPAIYDYDLDEATATLIDTDGSHRVKIGHSQRREVRETRVQTIYRLSYGEEYGTLYNAFKRAQQRVAEAMGRREDLLILSHIADIAPDHYGGDLTTTSYASKDLLAAMYQALDSNLLRPAVVLGSPALIGSLRKWRMQEVDQVTMHELMTTGYVDNLWGAAVLSNPLMGTPVGEAEETFYVLADKEFVGWLVIRQDVQVRVVDWPEEQQVSIVADEQIGLTLYNDWGVIQGTFNPSAMYTD